MELCVEEQVAKMQRGLYDIEFEVERRNLNRGGKALLVIVVLLLCSLIVWRGCVSAKKTKQIANAAEAVPADAKSPLELVTRPPQQRQAPAMRPTSIPATPRPQKKALPAAPAAAAEKRDVAPIPAPPASVSSADAPAVPADIRAAVAQADRRMAAGDLIGARALMLSILRRKEAESLRDYLERRLAQANEKLIFEDRPMPGKVAHTVAAGESVGKISRLYNTTQDYLFKVNRIVNASRISIGRELWVLNRPVFELVVSRRSLTAALSLNGDFFKRYAVGVGPAAAVGEYVLKTRVRQPAYRRARQKAIPFGSPGNILGKIQLPLKAASGATSASLHGTWDVSTLGTVCEEGGVRFSNADIEELTTLLPLGTKVVITE